MKASIMKLGEDEGCSALVRIDDVTYKAMDCFVLVLMRVEEIVSSGKRDDP